MGTITVRNLDDEVKRRLRLRAAANGRSMEEEAREALSLSVGLELHEASRTGADLVDKIRARFEPLGGVELELPPRGPGREPPTFE